MTELEILSSGPLALVEDLGRPGLAHLGVTRSGAADRRAHALANRLVANPGDRATVEVMFGGFTARVHGGDVAVAVTGADTDPGVNGKPFGLTVSPFATLLDVLRDDLGFTGTKYGCGEGECGACTVLLDGKAVNSCLVLAIECEGSEVVTIEGLETNGRLHPIQKAFVDYGAIQCGFCTPGMVMAAYALLEANPRPTEHDVRRALEGNLCRCTGYRKIIDAVLSLARGGAADG